MTHNANAASVCEDMFVRQNYSPRDSAEVLAGLFQRTHIREWFDLLKKSAGSIDIVDSVERSAIRIEINRLKIGWRSLDVVQTERSINLLGEHLFWYDKAAVVVEANQYRTRTIAKRNGATDELLSRISPEWSVGLALHESLHNFEQDHWRSLRRPAEIQSSSVSYDPAARIRLNTALIEISHRIEILLSDHFRSAEVRSLPNDAVIQKIIADTRVAFQQEQTSWNDLRVVATRESTASFVETLAIAAAKEHGPHKVPTDSALLAEAYSVHKQKLSFQRKTRVNESSIYIGYGFGADLLFLASARGVSQAKLAEIFRDSSDPFSEILDTLARRP
ncbi:MAG: hypothetical protein J0L82_14580 [Deltaproteobacteria bacterium]|nr:hypothetical protein [Deltaproteobacteria bacterium]